MMTDLAPIPEDELDWLLDSLVRDLMEAVMLTKALSTPDQWANVDDALQSIKDVQASFVAMLKARDS